MNVDVSLRYQFTNPSRGKRARRFSAAVGGVVVDSKRRGSLIPFGLLHNQNIPKSFLNYEEADL